MIEQYAGAYEWNPKKNQSNIDKHGISFERASYMFRQGGNAEIVPSNGEVKKARGKIGDKVYQVAHKKEGNKTTIISAYPLDERSVNQRKSITADELDKLRSTKETRSEQTFKDIARLERNDKSQYHQCRSEATKSLHQDRDKKQEDVSQKLTTGEITQRQAGRMNAKDDTKNYKARTKAMDDAGLSAPQRKERYELDRKMQEEKGKSPQHTNHHDTVKSLSKSQSKEMGRSY